MAIVYDMVTGKVTSDDEFVTRPAHATSQHSCESRLQTVDEAVAIEDMPPVDAYMVMLQEILKKL